MDAVGTELLLIVALLAVNGLLAMTEIAVVSVRKLRLRQRADVGDPGARAALRLADEPTRFLSTVQIGITLVGILAGAFGGATVAAQLDQWFAHVQGLAPYSEILGLGAVVLGITYLSLVMGELVPKRIGMSHPEGIATAMARPMEGLAWLARPVVAVLSASTEGLLWVLKVRPANDEEVTEEEIRFVVQQGAETGAIAPAERTLVERVLALADRRVDEVMTPRVDIVWLDRRAPEAALWQIITTCGHAYLPVCDGDVEHVLGIASTRNLLARRVAGLPLDLAAVMQPAPFVPETLHALALVERFRSPGMSTKLAVVIGEHGGVEGLVTPTDVLEAIVGDLPAGQAEATPEADGSWLVAGAMALDELASLLGSDVPGDDDSGGYSTVGGLAMMRLGRVPAVGDRFVWRDWLISVHTMGRNRVVAVRVAPELGALAGSRKGA